MSPAAVAGGLSDEERRGGGGEGEWRGRRRWGRPVVADQEGGERSNSG